MYLRPICRKKDGKEHHYWALVESYRSSRGPRQRIVAYLGELDEAVRVGVQYAAQDQHSHQISCFDDSKPEWVEVNVKGVYTERSRRFGDVWLALELLKKLGIYQFLKENMGSARAKISWADIATILIVARFCEPKSELDIAEHFYQSTCLEDLLGIPSSAVYNNRLYRALDKLLLQKDQLQKHLKERFGELFDICFDLYLYDVTSTYFEGQARRNPKAQRGYSRDRRPDCKQVLIALVVTKEGIPVGYEVFEGNRHDSKTVKEIVTKMEELYGQADCIWIMDRGMLSKDNLRFLRQNNRRYIIGAPKSQLKKFADELAKDDWQTIRDGIEVKLCRLPQNEKRRKKKTAEDSDVFILCRSADRKAKDQAIVNRYVDRIEKGLQRIQKSGHQQRIKKTSVAERQIGRLLEKNSRAAAFFEIHVKEQNDVVDVSWSMRQDKKNWAQATEGCYLLRSNITNWTPDAIWNGYIQLTEAEGAFRIEKDDLNLRPICHHKEDRVKAHIFVCFISLVLWKCFAKMCQQAGLGDEPRRIIQEFKNLQMHDVILPTRKGIDIRLRCVAKPDPHVAFLLHKLKLSPPMRIDSQHNN